MIVPKPYRMKAVLVTLVAVIGCVWLMVLIGDPKPMKLDDSATTHGEGAMPANRSSAIAPELSDDKAPPANRQLAPAVSERLFGRVIGRVVDTQGKGLEGIEVSLRTLRRANRGFFLRRTRTGSGGEFVLYDIDPEAVYVLFTGAIQGYPGYRLEGFKPENLPTPFEIRLVRLHLIDIEGTIVDAEHTPVANFSFTVDSLDWDYPVRIVTSDASGFFRLEAFPAGKLKFFTAEPEYFRVLGLQARGDRYDNLTLVIDRGKYQLSGRVLDRHGRPIPFTRITLNSTITGKEYQSVAYRTRRTDATGRFEFTGLGGIAHSLGVYATGYKPLITNHEFQSYSDQLEFRLLQ